MKWMTAVTVLLVAPSVAGAQLATCEPDTAAGFAVLEGTLRDIETSYPLQGAGVFVSWDGRDGKAVERRAATDRNGEFRICDVRTGTVVHVYATWFGKRSAGRDVEIGSAHSRVALEVASPYVAVSGRVLDDGTGAPLPAAAVRMGPGPEKVTGEDGAFLFDKIPPGIHVVSVERLGYATVSDSLEAEFGTRVEIGIRLSVQAVPLDPITVVVRSMALERSGFYGRQGRGIGSFITRQEVESRPVTRTSDLLRRIPGIRLVRGRFNDQLAVGRGDCPFRFIIDGTRLGFEYSLDEMPPHWLEGMEVYHGLSQVPIEFSAGPNERNASCGLIVIWTRNRS